MQILLLATWPFRRLALFVTSVIRHSLQWFDSDEKLEADSGKFWVAARGRSLATNAHWRGHGPFRNDATWHETGAMHKRLFIRAADWIGVDLHDCRIVEWGCGGGLNAVQFAAEAKEYFGVDVNSESLAECARQLAELNFGASARSLSASKIRKPQSTRSAVNATGSSAPTSLSCCRRGVIANESWKSQGDCFERAAWH